MKKNLFFHALFLTLLSLSFNEVHAQPTPFTCEPGVSYLFGVPDAFPNAATRAYVFNLATGTITPANGGNPLIDPSNNWNTINAIGYNVNNNYIYGWRQGTTQAVRVGSNWQTQFLGTNLANGNNQNFNVGDIDEYGLMWLYTQNATGAQAVLRLNLNNSPATGGWFNIPATNIADWAFSPVSKNLYAIERIITGGVPSFRLLEFVYSTSPTVTFTRNIKGTITGIDPADMGSGFGAVFMAADGTLYGSHNTSGRVYRINNPHSTDPAMTEWAATQVSQTGYITATNDGARCFNSAAVEPEPPVQPAFACSNGKSYLFQDSPTIALEYDLATGTATAVNGGNPLIPAGANRDINAIGYNPVDNYIWGARVGTNELVRVGADWSVEYFPITGLPANSNMNVGDVSTDGIYYGKSGAPGNAGHYKIDLNPGSPDYLKAVLVPVSYSQMADWSISPVDGNIYTIRNIDGHLVRIDPETGASTDLGLITGTGLTLANTVVGATFMDADGNLYLSNNDPGRIFKIAAPHTSNTAAEFLSAGPVSGQNDGARCALSAVPGVVQTPFTCEAGMSYLFSGPTPNAPTAAYEYNLATGVMTEAANPLIPGPTNNQVNAIGYNVVDNFIWGFRSGTTQVVRVGGDWSVEFFEVAGLPQGNYNVGDVDANGILYLYTSSDTKVYKVDLTQVPGLSATEVTVPAVNFSIADWAVSPIDGKLYSIGIVPGSSLASDYRLIEFDPVANTLSNLGMVTGGGIAALTGGFGAAFMDSNGALYASHNSTGRIYRIDAPHTGDLTAHLVITGGQSQTNDGARCFNAALPVTLARFEATRENTSALLTWTTTSEANSDRFEVEHSLDARKWSPIGTVRSKGESMELVRYAFTHGNPSAGLNFYRLKMVDLDGTFEFSPIRSVSVGSAGEVSSIPFPNPAAGGRIRVSNPVGVKKVILYNGQGNEVLSTSTVSGEGVDISGLPAGIYLMNILRDNHIHTIHKIVVEK